MEIISYKYAIPYFIFVAYLLVLMCWEFVKINRQQSTKDIRWLTIIGFLFFFGLRGFVGTDWANYYPFFEGAEDGSFSTWEPGFIFYTFLIKSICANYFFWIFISSLIDVILLHVIFKRYSKYYVLAFILFLAFNGFIMEINLMRNIKSILLFLLSIKYLKQRRILPYILLNSLGILFHMSSIIYLPLYFILQREIPKIFLWIIFFVGVIIFLLQIEYIKPLLMFFARLIGGGLPDKVDAYFGYELYNQYKAFSLGFFERLLSFFLIVGFRPKLIKQDSSNNIFINIFILFFICCFYIAEANEVMTRLSTLFICSYWILYPAILNTIKNKLNKQLFLLILIVFVLLRTSFYNTFLFKYDNILFGIQKYEQRKELLKKYSNNGVIVIKKNQ
jgi:hypothetical protein